MTIWSSTFLDQLALDAEQAINTELQTLFTRIYLPIQNRLSVYTLPSYIRTIRSITYRGIKLDPMNWEEFQSLTPGTVWVNNSLTVDSVQSRPLYYVMHPTNPYDIRLFPTPNENLDFPTVTTGNPFSPIANELHCTISCFRDIDTLLVDQNALLPSYIDRRTRKAFVLWKAFEAEGKGQNARASRYYKIKYKTLIAKFKAINEGCFVSKKYSLDDSRIEQLGVYPRPVLPTRFERNY